MPSPWTRWRRKGSFTINATPTRVSCCDLNSAVSDSTPLEMRFSNDGLDWPEAGGLRCRSRRDSGLRARRPTHVFAEYRDRAGQHSWPSAMPSRGHDGPGGQLPDQRRRSLHEFVSVTAEQRRQRFHAPRDAASAMTASLARGLVAYEPSRLTLASGPTAHARSLPSTGSRRNILCRQRCLTWTRWRRRQLHDHGDAPTRVSCW